MRSVGGDKLSTRLWAFAVWTVVGFFVLNLAGLIGSVLTSSFATRWLGTWAPAGMRFHAP